MGQVGDGLQAAVLTAQAWTHNLDNNIILKLDISNAFNTISRAACLTEIKRLIPEAYPWARWILIQPSAVWAKGIEFRCVEGTPQGNPMSPLLFDLALQPVPIPHSPLVVPRRRFAEWQRRPSSASTHFYSDQISRPKSVPQRQQMRNFRKCRSNSSCGATRHSHHPRQERMDLFRMSTALRPQQSIGDRRNQVHHSSKPHRTSWINSASPCLELATRMCRCVPIRTFV